MGDFLRKLNKALLLKIAEEFDTNVTQSNKVAEIRNAIAEASHYDADQPKSRLREL